MAEKEHQQRIPILVLRDDPQRGFQEDTVTTMVARTWVQVRLRHNLDPGADVMIFNKQSGYQAEFLMDSRPVPNEAKLLLRDHSVNIWQLDFGLPPKLAPDLRRRMNLVCIACQTRETVPLEEYEIEKLERTERLTRNCPNCAAETDWEKESVAQARSEAAGREKTEQERRSREERGGQLNEQAEVTQRAEEEAQAVAEQARQAAEEAAASEAAEATRHVEAQAAQRNAIEATNRAEAELTELTGARTAVERKAQEAATQIPEAESKAEAAAKALIKATKEAGEAEAKSEKLRREAEEAAQRAEQVRQRAQELAEKREQARNMAETARQSIDQARSNQEAAEREITQNLRKLEAAAQAKAAALKSFKESGKAAAKRAAELSKAAQVAGAAREQAEETTTRLEAAAAARLLVGTELEALLWPSPEVAAQPAAEAEAAPSAEPEVPRSERRTARRIFVRTQARIRRPSSSEVVAPVDVSRGGICFESRASYELDEVVWVAMHFREDAEHLETPSRIVRVSPGGQRRPLFLRSQVRRLSCLRTFLAEPVEGLQQAEMALAVQRGKNDVSWNVAPRSIKSISPHLILQCPARRV